MRIKNQSPVMSVALYVELDCNVGQCLFSRNAEAELTGLGMQ